LCVMDRVPRDLSESQQAALRALSRQVVSQLELRRAASEQTASEERLLEMFRTSPVPTAVHRLADGRYVFVNDAFLALVRMESNEVLGRTAEEAGLATAPWSTRVGAESAQTDEWTIVAADGGTTEVRAGVADVRLGGVPHVITTLVDITARKRAEAEATVLLQRLLLVSDAAAVGIWDWDLTTDAWYASPSFATVLGYPPKDAQRDRGVWLDRLHPDDRALVAERIQALCTSSAAPLDVLSRMRHADGRYRWVQTIGRALAVDEQGHATRIGGVRLDVSDRVAAEAQLARVASIVESSDDAIIGKDLDGVITSWNRGAETIFGYSASEMVGTPMMRLIPDDRLEEERHLLAAIARGERVAHFETVRRTKDGRLIHMSVSASPIRDSMGRVIGVSKVARDITERRVSETARRKSDERYRTLFDFAPDGIVISDPEQFCLDASPSLCRMLGYTREELVGMHSSLALVSSGGSDKEHARATAIGSEYNREAEFRRKDGSTFWAEVIATRMPDGNIMGMVRDVTERKIAAARQRRLVDSNVQGVMLSGSDGAITDANDAFLAIVGYTREDLEAHRLDWSTLTPPEYDEADRHALSELLARGVSTPYEKEYIRKDGSRVPILLGVASFEDNPLEGICFVLDLTERKRFEQQSFRAQRMESLGTLAGGIAHDLNNVLAPIMLSVEMLMDMVRDEEALECLTTLRSSVQHGAELVKQVLAFGRGVEGYRIVLDPVRVIDELLKVMRDTFPPSIEVHHGAPRDLWTVTGDPTQMHQVFLNLCVNARDAMPGGGTIDITLENVTLDDTYAAMNAEARPGAYVLVTFTDSGSGIPRAIIDRIFDPFFTTKEVGKGTGLGLSTTMTIVRSHGGFMHVYSEPGRGTTFKVFLPANTSEAKQEEAAVEQTRLPRGAGELVLVVDDEEAVRVIVRSTLERFGYRVLLAENGAEAVAMYAMHQPTIAVVLTDMSMPIMDGPATIIALRAMNPDVRIIGSSGLSSNGAIARAVGAGLLHFAPKPYTAESILLTLQKILHPAPDVIAR
jgi:PAS domain S-box-containing protein